MRTRCFSVPYGEKCIDVCVNEPGDVSCRSRCGVVLTHGAGGDMYFSQLTQLAEILPTKGFTVIRFTCKGLNLAYRIKVYTAVIDYVSANFKYLDEVFVAGRSMGARAAVGVTNNIIGTKLDNFINGVISLSYPLHLKDKKSDLRDSSLYELKKPSLFISGTKDDMCDRKLFEKVLNNVRNYELQWIDNADHSLKVKGSNESEVAVEIGEYISKWYRKYCKSAVVVEESKATTSVIDSSTRKSKRKSKSSIAGTDHPKKTKR